MSKWVKRGLKTGIVTTPYPAREDAALGISPGLPRLTAARDINIDVLMSRCPTGALHRTDDGLVVERARCVHCYRCARGVAKPLPWESGFEWAGIRDEAAVLAGTFQRSMHICVVDAGDCGACLNETKLLNNPLYNMHRLGFFITPTPRQADILLVVGPVTDHMKIALSKAYEAMPTPKRVMAVGACALSGAVFESGFVTGGGVADLLPVDVEIPGCPPPPLAILHGLLVLAGHKPAAQLTESVATRAGDEGGAR